MQAQIYDFRNFNVEDGLAQSYVPAIFQDRNGYLWFGTNGGGVNRYDGNKFINLTENDSLVNNVVFAITQSKNQNILFGTNGGLSIYNGEFFENYTEKEGLPHNRILSVAEDKTSQIWIATAKGVCNLINKKVRIFEIDSTLSSSVVLTIYVDAENNIWFGTIGNGLFKYNQTNRKLMKFSTKNGLCYNTIKAINQDSKGNIYVGTYGGINKITKDGKIELLNIKDIQDLTFTSIIIQKDNTLWLSSSIGVLKYKNEVQLKLDASNGLLGANSIYCSIIDNEENLWFGTLGFGVSKYAGETFVGYTKNAGLPSDYINSIFQDSKGNVWLGCKQDGVCKLEHTKIKNYKSDNKNSKNSIADNEVRTIAEDKNGQIYFGTMDGLSIFDGKNFKNYHSKDGLPNNTINNIFIDKQEQIWLATNNGICYLKDNKIEKVNLLDKFISDNSAIPIYAVFQDAQNVFWFATDNGVIKSSNGKSEKITKAQGFSDKRVRNIVQDKKGTVWFATDDGIFAYNNTQFSSISVNNGLASNKAYLLQLDNDANIWVGTTNGLDRINLDSYYKNKRIEITHFSKEDGFKGLECNTNASYKSRDGKLWFGTVKGAYVFNPTQYKKNEQEAFTHITGLRLFFESDEKTLLENSKGIDSITNLPKKLILPYDKNHITFDFISICLKNPSAVKYQFKLEGMDKDWFPPTSETKATYSSLPAGDYTFYLKATNNEGLWNKTPITFNFSILPPWWKTWWFYTLAFFFFSTSIYFYINLRTKNLKNAKIALEKEVALRTQQLRDEKEIVEFVNKEVTAQKAIIERKNIDIMDSIKYAKNIQEALLPPLENIYNELKEAFVLYMPKDIVSGDFYWFIKRNNKKYLAVVDCTGHGVPGAFMSIIGNTLLNEIIIEKNILQPAEILNELHIGVKQALKQNNSGSERRDGMDIVLCAFNEQGNEVEYAGANRALWIFRNNNPKTQEIIKPNKFPIGGIEFENETKRQFTNHSIQLNKGDKLYLFSDGYADQFGGPKGKKFMVGNLQKLLEAICHLPMNEQQQIIHETFTNWKKNNEQVDDVLVIGISA